MSQNSNDMIHVNAYIKDDGTKVSDYWRRRNGGGGSFLPQENYKIMDEPENPMQTILEKLGFPPFKTTILPEGNYTDPKPPQEPMEKLRKTLGLPDQIIYAHNAGLSPLNSNVDAGAVLRGGVEMTTGGVLGKALSALGPVGEFLGAVVTVAGVAVQIGVKVAQAASKLSEEAAKTGKIASNSQNKIQLYNYINDMEKTQTLLRFSIDKNAKKFSAAKDQKEHAELYDIYKMQNSLYHKNNQVIRNIKTTVANDDYKTVLNEAQLYDKYQKEAITPKLYEKIQELSRMETKPEVTDIPEKTNKIIPNAGRFGIDKFFSASSNKINTPDALKMWELASSNFKNDLDYIRQNGAIINSVYHLPQGELQQTVQAKLEKQLGVKDAIGVIFKPESTLSQAIANSPEFKRHIKPYAIRLLKGEIIKNASIYFGSSKNLAWSLGHADILYTYVDPSGNLHAIVLDTYDFNANNPDWKVKIARSVQDAGLLRNYYTLNIIFIPKNIWINW